MSTDGKLKSLELIEGLTGWIWIGASIATVAFIGLALAAGWSWWNAIYAAVVSFIAKWLTRGLLINQRRVLFEAEMVEAGLSPEEAGAAWQSVIAEASQHRGA